MSNKFSAVYKEFLIWLYASAYKNNEADYEEFAKTVDIFIETDLIKSVRPYIYYIKMSFIFILIAKAFYAPVQLGI